MVQGPLRRNQAGLERALERLASGFRINSAADDAAGVSLSARLQSRSRSYVVAERNTSTAISMAATADSGASEISDSLIRLRELSVQAKDGTLTSSDRSALDVEFQGLLVEVDRLAAATTFNGSNLLAGVATSIAFQVGIDGTSNDVISVEFGGVSVSNLGLSGTSVTGSGVTNATAAMTAVDAAFVSLGTTRAKLGSGLNRLGFALANDQGIRTQLDAAVGATRDADVVEEATNVARYQVLIAAGASVLATANGLAASFVTKLLGL